MSIGLIRVRDSVTTLFFVQKKSIVVEMWFWYGFIGGAGMHHPLTPHESWPNKLRRPRRVIILRYCGVAETTSFQVRSAMIFELHGSESKGHAITFAAVLKIESPTSALQPGHRIL